MHTLHGMAGWLQPIFQSHFCFLTIDLPRPTILSQRIIVLVQLAIAMMKFFCTISMYLFFDLFSHILTEIDLLRPIIIGARWCEESRDGDDGDDRRRNDQIH